ncbi:phosphatase PAP2 family protein [Asanoa sp. WMMD1127]|uniref:phosphatase PAP2 family protein n=1 Tax=Asanoa sp. WMMD1127 TaxID=3016107 RepID=UPI00241789B8|nr:phosphatase PAP2 family protein [Asanoa sp. WMMD1127]MDG4826373.1 phosphatase PAP2 family protein [Asanoa sp. WMMD1127]
MRQVLLKVLLPLVALYGLMIAIGLFVTKVADGWWPFTAEDDVNTSLEAARSGPLTAASLVFSTIADTWSIIAVCTFAVVILVVTRRPWREPLFLAGAVAAQALIFLLTTLAIDRHRPAVEHMDVSPPTSSFPSGHTSAATALYCGLALLFALRSTSGRWEAVVWTVFVLIPLGVAMTRLYRGMHHPSDVIGSFINAGLCLTIMYHGVLRWRGAPPPRPVDTRKSVSLARSR